MGAAMSERVRRHVSRLWWLEMRGLVVGPLCHPMMRAKNYMHATLNSPEKRETPILREETTDLTGHKPACHGLSPKWYGDKSRHPWSLEIMQSLHR